MEHCVLDDQGLLIASGPDAATFLQGQLTNDVRAIASERVVLAACNTPQGRVAALVRIVARDGALWLLLPRGLVAPLVERLRRYVLRAKVQFRDASGEFAFVGRLDGGGTPLHERGTGSVSRVRLRGGTLLVGSEADVATEVAGMERVDPSRWHAAQIAAGEPDVPPEAAEEWIAQMLNLDLLDGISFTKGCYTGQEIVARTQHLGRIKRRAFRYRAAGASVVPASKQSLLLDGTKVGEVIRAARGSDGVDLLAVVGLEQRDRPLTTDDGAVWLPQPLPYEIPG
jgi:folate-binding protein YgfZ